MPICTPCSMNPDLHLNGLWKALFMPIEEMSPRGTTYETTKKVIPVPYLHAVCLRLHYFKNVKSLIYFHIFIILSSSNKKEISDFIYLRKVCAVQLFDFPLQCCSSLYSIVCNATFSNTYLKKGI